VVEKFLDRIVPAWALRVTFDSRLKLEFQGAKVTSGAGQAGFTEKLALGDCNLA